MITIRNRLSREGNRKKCIFLPLTLVTLLPKSDLSFKPRLSTLVPKPQLGNAFVFEAHRFEFLLTRSWGFSASVFPSWGLGTRKRERFFLTLPS